MQPHHTSIIKLLLASRSQRSNLKTLGWMLALAGLLVLLFTTLFFIFMHGEGRQYSLVSGLYWTTTVMTTLGFGDITFTSDVGRSFSVVVMVTGMLFQSVILPFIFIQLLWTPWVESQRLARIPRVIEDTVTGHVIITDGGKGTAVLLRRLAARGLSAWVMVSDEVDAAARHDRGERVLAGQPDDPLFWRAAGINRATLAVCNCDDAENALAVVTLRELADRVTVVATANDPAMAEVLHRAGADLVVQPHVLVGRSMAQRVRGGSRQSVIGELGGLNLVTMPAAALNAEGQTLAELALPTRQGVEVLAIWERGRPLPAIATHRLDRDDTLVLAGTAAALKSLDGTSGPHGHVIVAGAGRVAHAAVVALQERGVAVTILAPQVPAWLDGTKHVVGHGTDAAALERSGLATASALLVATHDDPLNTAITLRARMMRGELEIVARAETPVNVSSLYRSGADLVISRPSMVANACFNALHCGQVLVVAEGLFVVRVPVPAQLAGQTLAQADLQTRTGLTVVALEPAVKLTPATVLAAEGHVILAGPEEAVDRWYRCFAPQVEAAPSHALVRLLPFLRTRR